MIIMSGDRIRALYLQPAPLFGGAERQAAYAASFWPEFGVDVLPVVGPGHAVIDWLHERGVKEFAHTEHFPGSWSKIKGLRRAMLPHRYLLCGVRARAQIAELVAKHDMDLIVASLPFAWITGTLVARNAGIPTVWRAGGSEINVVQKSALWLVTRLLRPDLLLCVGEAVRRTFSPLVPAPVAVVRNGVDHSMFRPGNGNGKGYRPEGADCVVGCAERLTLSKRPQDFVALAALMRDHFPRTRFLLAGDGSRRSSFERMAREARADNLDFLGFVADMPSFYDTCDIVVLPSGAEGCPNVVLEAMAMGKPIVAAGVAALLELVQHGDNGLVYELGNVAQFAKLVGTLIDNPDRRAALGAGARKTAHDLNAREHARVVTTLLKKLVAEHRARARAELGESSAPSQPARY
jgi:glycosyltransferase involved in cell wall biosynthesis